MKAFTVIVRTSAGDQPYNWIAESSGDAAEQVASLYEEPCGITVRHGAC